MADWGNSRGDGAGRVGDVNIRFYVFSNVRRFKPRLPRTP